MDKSEARAAHDLMLERIARGLKEEDRSNAEMWRDEPAEKRLAALFELSDFMRAMVRSRGFPIDYGELEFPGLPRPVK
ncbi:MAG: hypothetical protein AB7J35_22185 [Dehalococcoidia bacterium]